MLSERTAVPVQNALKDAGITASDLGKVLLVGGSTRMINAQEKVKALTGMEPSKSINPDEGVAIGAGIQGGKLSGEAVSGDVLLLDVTPLSLGIETLGGVMTKIIEKGTTIPTKKSQVFSTAEDNQSAVTIMVLQGEREFARDNKSLGNFNLEGIPAAPRGVPQIEVEFDIDANGILTVSAKDKATGKAQNITISGSSGLSEDEINSMVKDAELHKEEDKKRKDAVEARNQADALVHQTEKSMSELGEKVPAEDRSNIEAALNDLKEVLKDENSSKEQIDAKVEALSKASHKLAEAMYKKDENAGANGGNNKKDDDVIDAEVE